MQKFLEFTGVSKRKFTLNTKYIMRIEPNVRGDGSILYIYGDQSGIKVENVLDSYETLLAKLDNIITTEPQTTSDTPLPKLDVEITAKVKKEKIKPVQPLNLPLNLPLETEEEDNYTPVPVVPLKSFDDVIEEKSKPKFK